jgi:hypothetical protein
MGGRDLLSEHQRLGCRAAAIKRLAPAALLAVTMCSAGCAAVPYHFTPDIEQNLTFELPEGQPQVDRGKPNWFLDGIGNYLISLPTKIIFLNWSLANHKISEEQERELLDYLHANGLYNVKVRLNSYSPGDEWWRLASNTDVNPAWRWTIGMLSVLQYTIFPGRLFAGWPFFGGTSDAFNPYTNTLYIWSGDRAIMFHEGGHAKDYAGMKYRGTMSALRIVPPVAWWQEAVATGDAIGYERIRGTRKQERRAYRVLYPAFASYLGGTASSVLGYIGGVDRWIQYAVQGGVIVAGHIVGQTRALFVPQRTGSHTPPAGVTTPPDTPASSAPRGRAGPPAS